MTDRNWTSYVRVFVDWDSRNGGQTAYLTDEVTTTSGWAYFTPDGWMWSDEPDGPGNTEFFEAPEPHALPSARIHSIVWPESA